MKGFERFSGRSRRERIAGGVAVQAALALIVLLGGIALGTEVVYAMFKQRQMQSAADSAALAAATARVRGYPASFTAEAVAVAGASGFPDGEDGIAVAVISPPTQGTFATRPDAVEVVISQPQTLSLIGLFREDPVTVRARAVALIGAGTMCALSLDPSDSGAVRGSGGAAINLEDCGLAVNSSSGTAVTLSGGASITASDVNIVGDYTLSGGATITADNGIVTGSAPFADPYAGVAVPAVGPCDFNNYKASGGTVDSLSPGVYCKGIKLSGGSQITLAPGIYILDRGDLEISGGSTLTGDGVTIVLTSSTGSQYGEVSFSGGAVVQISAPSDGPTAGIAFFQDRDAPSSGSNEFTGGDTQVINGAVYFPSQEIRYSGGATLANECTQLIARTIRFSGGATLRPNCAGYGTLPISSAPARLVE